MEDYEIVEIIAQGGYGIVLKAIQKSTGQMVAIKQFRDNDSYSQRIAEREISFLKLLHGHPNIIKLLTSFQQRAQNGGQKAHVFMVFELMQQTLLDVLNQAPGGKLDRENVRLIVYQMVKAIEHMHGLNAVHRDIKPENMLLQRVTCGGWRNQQYQAYNSRHRGRSSIVEVKGSHSLDRLGSRGVPSNIEDAQNQDEKDSIFVLKVCDLGQCRTLVDKDTNLTEYVSTRWYRAPELLLGSKTYDKSVDIWALGCMIPELISGRPLFPGNTNFEALAYVIKTLGNNLLTKEQIAAFHANNDFQQYGRIPLIKKVVPLEERVPDLLEDDLDFVKKCLSVDPILRPSAKDLLQHPYLSINKHIVLQKYEATLQLEQSAENNGPCSEESKEHIQQETDSDFQRQEDSDSLLRGDSMIQRDQDREEITEELCEESQQDQRGRFATEVMNQDQSNLLTSNENEVHYSDLENPLAAPSSEPEVGESNFAQSRIITAQTIKESVSEELKELQNPEDTPTNNPDQESIFNKEILKQTEVQIVTFAACKKGSANSRIMVNKKRPSSSGQQANQISNNDGGKTNILRQAENGSQQKLVVQKQNSEESNELVQQTSVLNQQEIDNANMQQEKQQLPKPILFLRKQKYDEQRMQRSSQHNHKDEKKYYQQMAMMMENDGELQGERNSQQEQRNNIVSGNSNFNSQNINEMQHPLQRNRVIGESKQLLMQKRGDSFVSSHKHHRLIDQTYQQQQNLPNNFQDATMRANKIKEGQKPLRQANGGPLYMIQKNKILYQNIKNTSNIQAIYNGQVASTTTSSPPLKSQKGNSIDFQKANQQQYYQPIKMINQQQRQAQLKDKNIMGTTATSMKNNRNVSQPQQQQIPENIVDQIAEASQSFKITSPIQPQGKASLLPQIGQSKATIGQKLIAQGQMQSQQQSPQKMQNNYAYLQHQQHQQLMNTQKHVTNKLQLPSIVQVIPSHQISLKQQNYQQAMQMQQQEQIMRATNKAIPRVNQNVMKLNQQQQLEQMRQSQSIKRLAEAYQQDQERVMSPPQSREVTMKQRNDEDQYNAAQFFERRNTVQRVNVMSRGSQKASLSPEPNKHQSPQVNAYAGKREKLNAPHKQPSDMIVISSNPKDVYQPRFADNYQQFSQQMNSQQMQSGYFNSPPKFALSRNSISQKKAQGALNMTAGARQQVPNNVKPPRRQ